MQILGIDIGGTGIKAAIVDSKTGELLKLKTSSPNTKTCYSRKCCQRAKNTYRLL